MAKDENAKVEMGGREIRTEDAVCRVRVYLSATDAKSRKPLKNNITQTLYVRASKVSAVAQQIAKALG